VEFPLRSFLPWLASILLVVAVENNVVQDPAHVVFIISKNSYSTKSMVILHFSTLSPFWLKPTVHLLDKKILEENKNYFACSHTIQRGLLHFGWCKAYTILVTNSCCMWAGGTESQFVVKRKFILALVKKPSIL
jgi:hypothetical protein